MDEPDHETTDDLTVIGRRFAAEWEAREAGRVPTLQTYLERYPHHAADLTDFALTFLGIESAAARLPEAGESAEPSPLARQAAARARQTLGLPDAPPLPSLTAARQAKGWTPADLAERLRLPPTLLLWLESGEITDWPARLEQRLSDLLAVTEEQAAAWLRAAGTPLAFPGSTAVVREKPSRSFAEALTACGADTATRGFWR
jgi:hypothetical protein